MAIQGEDDVGATLGATLVVALFPADVMDDRMRLYIDENPACRPFDNANPGKVPGMTRLINPIRHAVRKAGDYKGRPYGVASPPLSSARGISVASSPSCRRYAPAALTVHHS